MNAPPAIGGNQKLKLARFVRLIGLPEDAVQFLRCENRTDILSNVDPQDRRPLVIELTSGLSVPAQRIWLDISQSGAGQRDSFFFGRRSPSRYQGQGARPEPEVSEAERSDNTPLSEVCFSNEAVWGPLKGLRANWPVSCEPLPIAEVEPSGYWRPLITIRNEPWLQRTKADGATAFLWAAAHLPDISEPLKKADEGQSERLLPLLPLLVFLRHVFGKRTWHVPMGLANIIIDDPPVRDRFGFFAPARYLASLADIAHVTTVGFIPWNWDRSTPAAAELFRSNRSRLLLCIHGCDHTAGEFASSDQTTLAGKCQLALQRAELLRERTGLSCQRVMVFPQGLFSKAAMAALRETTFLAAVNSTLFPIDSRPTEVRLADLMEPAFTGIEDFPVFLRRYPRDPVLCAVDLFLGRPLLIVEHHRYFRNGHADCRRFLEAINGFQSPPSWVPLDQIVQSACLHREIESGRLEVRFYTNIFVLENSSAQRLSYRLVRRWNRPELIRGVLVDGSPVAHTFEDGQVAFSIELSPQTSATICLVLNSLRATQVFKGSLHYRAWVWTRRNLCDLRDNHSWMSHCVQRIKLARRRVSHLP